MDLIKLMEKDDKELYKESMKNAYLILTDKLTFDELFDYNGCYLPYNPKKKVEDSVYDNLIDYFCSLEEYEKCAEIKIAKKDKNLIKNS